MRNRTWKKTWPQTSTENSLTDTIKWIFIDPVELEIALCVIYFKSVCDESMDNQLTNL